MLNPRFLSYTGIMRRGARHLCGPTAWHCALGGSTRPTEALRKLAEPEEGNSWMEPSVTPPAIMPPSGE